MNGKNTKGISTRTTRTKISNYELVPVKSHIYAV